MLAVLSKLDLSDGLAVGGLIATVCFGVLSVVLYMRGRRVKRPTFVRHSNNLVRDLKEQVAGVEMLFRGDPIHTLTITKIAFWNAGHETIDQSDIAVGATLAVVVPDDAEILDASVIQQSSAASRFRFTNRPSPQRAEFTFDYLDWRDVGILQVIHTSPFAAKLEGSIKGAGAARNFFNRPRPMLRVFLPIAVASAVATTVIITYGPEGNPPAWVLVALIAVMLAGVALSTYLIPWNLPREVRRLDPTLQEPPIRVD